MSPGQPCRGVHQDSLISVKFTLISDGFSEIKVFSARFKCKFYTRLILGSLHSHISFCLCVAVANLWFVICDDQDLEHVFTRWLNTNFCHSEDRITSARPQVLINLCYLKWYHPCGHWGCCSSSDNNWWFACGGAALEIQEGVLEESFKGGAPSLFKELSSGWLSRHLSSGRHLPSAGACASCRAIASCCHIASCASRASSPAVCCVADLHTTVSHRPAPPPLIAPLPLGMPLSGLSLGWLLPSLSSHATASHLPASPPLIAPLPLVPLIWLVVVSFILTVTHKQKWDMGMLHCWITKKVRQSCADDRYLSVEYFQWVNLRCNICCV